jgi:hypothetical protein
VRGESERLHAVKRRRQARSPPARSRWKPARDYVTCGLNSNKIGPTKHDGPWFCIGLPDVMMGPFSFIQSDIYRDIQSC